MKIQHCSPQYAFFTQITFRPDLQSSLKWLYLQIVMHPIHRESKEHDTLINQ